MSHIASVVIIAYNDTEHVRAAVRSALAQGPAVAEVIAVDDASTDGTGELLDTLARQEPRLRVIHRKVNSGGCGSPRNDGIRAATAPYVMFLDSDDVLPQGAVQALLDAAQRHDAPVAAGACVRRELPSGSDTGWQRGLFLQEAVYASPGDHPRLVRDTLCVNKLYARSFLTEHAITFPEGAFRYEDFVFTAQVLAAAERMVIIPDTVYIWHVRRAAARPSISLDRSGISNWLDRLTAHRRAVEVFEDAGATLLAHAARVKFLDHDLRMYVRELTSRGSDYQHHWWRAARDHLAAFDETDLRAARGPGRWLARVIMASPAPRDLPRMAELAARPARLLPPYAAVDGRPVWADDLPQVELDQLSGKPLHRLPITVEAELTGGARSRLRVRVHDVYGRLAEAGVLSLDIEMRHRDDGRLGQIRSATLRAEADGWTAGLLLDLNTLAADSPAGDGGALDVWDLYARIRCRGGRSRYTAVRPTGAGLRRTAVPSRRHGLLLVQPYLTNRGSLALRIAPGLRGATEVFTRKVRRLATAR
ncbi:glycosyltransferase family 2 protein [Streptomyces gobiensis]|uniref:glycosyltransferase family 2 protein n=1 Tax=Streptomyces gobiensis TaxID=2875706 RepID=UPI001E468E0F|nr:glycosyltransferase family 2 protein [Streptomyces gobiensis]UGY91729.1 glycosyltransferase [Streptomyces gobiensis]